MGKSTTRSEPRLHCPEHTKLVARALCAHSLYIVQTRTHGSVGDNSAVILRVITPQTLRLPVSCLYSYVPCPVLPQHALFSLFILRVIRPQPLCSSLSCLYLFVSCPVLPECKCLFPCLASVYTSVFARDLPCVECAFCIKM